MLAALPISIPVPKSLFQQDAQLGLCPFLQNHYCLATMVNNLLDTCSSYK